MQVTIHQDRLARITKLYSGSHDPNGKMCAMEAVAYVAGEPWSDHPECACPVIATFMRDWNDGLSDEDRDRLLLPLIPRLVGTKGSKKLEARRATMSGDWYVRVQLPAWLRLAGLKDHADKLSAFPEITSFAKTPAILPALQAAQKDSSAAGSAAGSAAESAAGSAAWTAAWSAAWSAAWTAVEPTRIALQESAIALVERMIETK